MRKRSFFLFVTVLVLSVTMSAASALDKSTLYNGCKGEEVKKLQQALIDQGYLGGYADGIFGRNTENAVRKFQSKHHLKSDGLAGKKTQELLFGKASASSASSSSSAASSASSSASSAASSSASSSSAASTGGSGSLFGGDYATIRVGAKGSRVRSLQQALSAVGAYTGAADGHFGSKTLEAVTLFQKSEKLTADGLAGKKTLKALEQAVASGKKIKASASSVSSGSSSSQSAASGSSASSVSAPDASSVRLLHWYNDIKPSIRNGQHLLIYDPSTKLSWTLKILSRGRHCDAEPLTREDTDTMVKAFGGVYTWDVKKVYVRLPNGTWTIGSTHDRPHEANTIKDNGFDGHLCVHFLRNMAETEELDPNYGVTNQKAIRSFWKSLTGEEIDF